MNISFECFIPSLNIIHHVIEITTFTLWKDFKLGPLYHQKTEKKIVIFYLRN